jgi:regulator of replication initiation timing
MYHPVIVEQVLPLSAATDLAKQHYAKIKGLEIELSQVNEENKRLRIQNRKLMRKKGSQS